MIQFTEKQLAALSLLLGKLREKTSVLGYLVAALSFFGVNNPGLAEQIAGGIGLGASLILVLFNDATVRSWIVRAAPTPAEAMEPVPVEISPTVADAATEEVSPMSFITIASNVIAKFQAVAALLPLLTSLVQTVEATLPAGTAGATKLKAVEDALASVYEKEQVATASFNDVWPLLAGVAGTLVATFKATGAFTSSTAAVAPVAAVVPPVV